MNDRFIRKYSHELPEKVVKNCPEFAGAQPGKASASGGGGNTFRNIIAPVLVAFLVVAGVAAGLIMANYMKNRNPDAPNEPSEINITNGTPEATEPELTPTAAPTEPHTAVPTTTPTAEQTKEPTLPPTALPTATPDPTATHEPAETPEPLYPSHKIKIYYFRKYDEIAGILCEKSFGVYDLLRDEYEEYRDDFGPLYGRLLELFADGTLKPTGPMLNGELAAFSWGELHTNGWFNLPWIDYTVKTDGGTDGRYIDVWFTYPELIEGYDLSRSSIAEIISLLAPGIPLPVGDEETSSSEYLSIKNETLMLRDGTVDAIKFTRKELSGVTRFDYMFLLNGCILAVTPQDTLPNDEFFKTFSTGTFKADLSELSTSPERVERSTDSSKITREEAKQLIRDGYNIVNSMKGYFEWYEVGHGSLTASLANSFTRLLPDEQTVRFVRPVMEGYDEAGVRALVNATFLPKIAEYLNRNETFYSKYRTLENGRTYYYYPEGAQIDYYRNFRLSEEDLDSLVLDEQAGTGWLITKAIDMYSGDTKDRDVIIKVSFKWNNGWKLASMDAADAALREYATGFEAKEFSVDNARRIIETVVCDLYMWTRVDTEGLLEESIFEFKESVLSEPEHVYRGARQFDRIAGTMADPQIWHDYAARFLTESMADRILNGGNYLLFTDRAVYAWTNYGDYRDLFGSYVTDRFVLEVLSATDTRATVRLSGWDIASYSSWNLKTINDSMLVLDFEFELVGGVWKISGGNFIDRLDAVFTYPETEPYSADLDPSLAPPAPGKDSWSGCFVLFRNAIAEKAYNVTTYRDVHLKPGEALKIPVFWSFIEPLPEGSYELSIEFEESDSVRFEMLNKDEAPECEACFVATALKPGKATVRLYGSYDPDKLGDNVKGLSSYGKDAGNLLIDVVLTVYVEG
ncbi:MAG: hypothetical protein J5950_06760 [Clostridia bacterium]|nr:hypothetical protein [Clostridia bacterium]